MGKKIVYDLTNRRSLDKQAKYRLRKRRAGKCLWCSSKTDGGKLCPKCRMKHKLRMRERRNGGAWTPLGRGRAPREMGSP